MALHYRTLGFVVKKRDSGEADRIFTLITQGYGKINLLGRAIRKISSKLKGGLDMASLSEVEFIQGKSFKTLTDAVIVEKYKNTKSNILKNKVAHKIAKIADSLLPFEEKEKTPFELLEKTYLRLNREDIVGDRVQLVYFYFVWNFFTILGYKPELYKCAKCRRKVDPENIHFASREGGLLCDACQAQYLDYKIKVNADVVKILRIILKRSWGILEKVRISKPASQLLKDLSSEYYFYLLAGHSVGQRSR